MDFPAWSGAVGRGDARLGTVWLGEAGITLSDLARSGDAGHGAAMQAKAWCGGARHGMEYFIDFGPARHGLAMRDRAGRGAAWHGLAGRGYFIDFPAWLGVSWSGEAG